MNNLVRATMLILLMSAIIQPWAYAQDMSFTQQDRERLTRVEEGLKAANQRIDDGFNALNHRMDDLNTRMYDLRGLMQVLIGGMLTLVGFIL
ncbi:MAG: hypothetical protein HQK97_00315 [Nitrospirae bacterium]|nr:hypothetical protein [Nitrospirota bacterium]